MFVTEDFSNKAQNFCKHNYHEHTDIVLWHCKKCNEGFHYKSNRLKHQHACPNKDGADIYPGCAPYNEELEETFKPKTAFPVKIPTDPQPEDQPEDQPLVVEDQPLEVEDQPQQVSQLKLKRPLVILLNQELTF